MSCFWASANVANALYLGDALDLMADQPEASIDLILTDPPYCSGAVQEAQRVSAAGQGLRRQTIKRGERFAWFSGDNMGTAGLVFLLRSIAFEATRALRPSGVLALFCDWRMVATLSPAIESAGLRSQAIVVWDKGSMGLGLGFRPQHELVLVFTNGKPAWHAADTSNVLRCSRISSAAKVHPTEKPIEILRRIVRVASPKDGLVVDPFCGSGPTGAAAIREGRRFTGFDRDPVFLATARERLAAEIRSPQLPLTGEGD